jgi:hypothetical protein
VTCEALPPDDGRVHTLPNIETAMVDPSGEAAGFRAPTSTVTRPVWPCTGVAIRLAAAMTRVRRIRIMTGEFLFREVRAGSNIRLPVRMAQAE